MQPRRAPDGTDASARIEDDADGAMNESNEIDHAIYIAAIQIP